MRKKLVMLLGIALLVISCQKDLYEIKSDEPSGESRVVQLNFGGEILNSETPLPLSKAAEPSRDLYGISISRLTTASNGTVSSKTYAYGLFDNVKELKVNLLDGYRYKIVCSMIKDGKDSLAVNGEDKYNCPFDMAYNGSSESVPGEITNKFVLAEDAEGKLSYLCSLESNVIQTNWQNKDYKRPFIQRYYGTIDTLMVSEAGQARLDLYRRYFAVNYKAQGLKMGRRLKIEMTDAPTIWLNETNNSSGNIYISSANLNSKIVEGKVLMDNVGVKITAYQKGDEVGKVIYDRKISFKRNTLNTMSITDIDNFGETMQGNIHIEEGELPQESIVDIPWQSE